MPFDGLIPENSWEDRLAPAIERWRAYLSAYPLARATADFETRSAHDLKKHGGYMYSLHGTTQAMCLSYKLPGEPIVRRWHMAHPQHLIAESDPPVELFAFILAGGRVEAHNAFFERCIWTNVMVVRHGWPAVPPGQWMCSAAKASAASLPRDLDGACRAMGLPIEKDMVGNRLMQRMCKPRQPRKAEIQEWMDAEGLSGDYRKFKARFTEANGPLWHEDEEDIYRLWEYCDGDVLAEEALSRAVPDLSAQEQALWLLDQDMNWRGVRFDLELAEAALDLAKRWRRPLNDELEAMTGISSATKRADVKAWLLEHEGLELPDTAAETLEWYVEREPISGRARRICEIVMDVNRTSTRKYQAMLDRADPGDWRIRDLLMYHGAGTGRWSGKGVQVHNFPARDLIVKDFDEACEAIKSRDLDWCVALFGDVMKLLSHALRGAIVPTVGMDLMVADYSAIEARCVLWEADALEALKVFYRGEDIYCDMATGIYGYKVVKGVHKNERQFGKQAILGLGYGMGFVTFLLTCRKYKIHFTRADVIRIMGLEKTEKYEAWVTSYLCLDGPPTGLLEDPEAARSYANKKRNAAKVVRRLVEARESPRDIVHELALMKYTVDVYRSRYPQVKDMWKAQEEAAIRAVELGGRVECGKVAWEVADGWLHCWLPSGRPIRYRDPEVKMVRTAWGEMKKGLRYMSVNGVTRKWERTATYGGKLVENITQAIARDIMANAMVLAAEGGVYHTGMSVHDELVCEVGKNEGSVDDFEALMSSIPPWAHGCPITAEAERLGRYKK